MEIIIDEKKYEVKNFLNSNEFRTLIKISIEAFINGQPISGDGEDLDSIKDEIIGYVGNPGCFYDSFCNCLGYLCIKDFDSSIHEIFFNHGKYEELIENIINAKKAYEIANENLNMTLSLSNTLNQFLTILTNKLPEGKDLEKMTKNLPKEWNKVFSEYKSIIKTK